MVEFYRDVLGLKALSAEALGGNAMIRYPSVIPKSNSFPSLKAPSRGHCHCRT
jgi:hypothetical protein